MKSALTFLVTCVLVLPFSSSLLPSAYAKIAAWQWGRGSTGSTIVDAYAVATDPTGNIYSAGINLGDGVDNPVILGGIPILNTAGRGNPATGYPHQTFWAKYNSAGAVLWADGTQFGDAYLMNITSDASGNLIVFGSFDSDTLIIDADTLVNAYGNTYGIQYFVAKFDPTGALLWALNDGNAAPGFLGNGFLPAGAVNGVNPLATGGVTTDASGNIYITSSFSGATMSVGGHILANADVTGNTADIFVAKYSPTGTLVWVKTLGGTSDDFGYGIAIGAAGNVYITGAFWSSSMNVGASTLTDPYGTGGYMYPGMLSGGTPLAYIAELSAGGAPLWGQAGGGNAGAFGTGITSDASGNIYLTGGFANPTISFGGATVAKTYPGNPYLALYLVQFNPANTVVWSKTVGSASQAVFGFSIALTPCGGVWVSGNYSEDAITDGITIPYVTGGTDPVFIAGYNHSGSVIGFDGLSSGGDDQSAIASDLNGNLYMCSDYEVSAPIVIGPDVLPASLSGGQEQFYLAKYSYLAMGDTTITFYDTICTNGFFNLTADSNATAYMWNTGATTLTIAADTSGLYWVNELDYCIGKIDTFKVFLKPIPSVIATNNGPVCTGINDTLFLQATSNFGATYFWLGPHALVTSVQNLFRTPVIMDLGGVYQVTATLNGCVSPTVNDTVIILQTPPLPWLKDTFFCQNLDAPRLQAFGDSIVWYPTDNISVGGSLVGPIPPTTRDTMMWFFVTDTKMGCSTAVDSFSVTVQPKPLLTVSPSVNICQHDTVVLQATDADPLDYIHWSPSLYLDDTVGLNTVSRPLNDVNYTIVTRNEYGCYDTAFVSVHVHPVAELWLGDSVTLYPGQSYQISPQTNCMYFNWLPAAGLDNPYFTNPIATPQLSTKYVVHAETEWGCKAVDSIYIRVDPTTILTLPNAFSPGFGPNNLFKIILTGEGQVNYFRIFDRWGVMVFQTMDINEGWDGSFKGVAQPFGVYVYEVSATTATGQTFTRHGNVTLLR